MNCIQFTFQFLGKVENILKGSLDSISSPLHTVKIQIMAGKVCLKSKGRTLLFQQTFCFQKFVDKPRNVLALHFNQTFPAII